MKPTKNKFHCPACQHSKMLFTSRKEAIRFLQYNADEIETQTGKRPVRAYYCTACCGWHVTSRPHSSAYHSLVNRYGDIEGQKIFDEVTLIKGKRQGIRDGLGRKIKQLRHILKYKEIDVDRCQKLINQLINHFETVMTNSLEEESAVMGLFGKFSALCSLFIQKKQLQTFIA